MLNKIITKKPSNVQHDLTNLFNGLFPSWPTMLATMLAVTVLMIVLTKYLWKPVKKYVSDRHNFIQTNIDNSTKQQTDAIHDRKRASDELYKARLEAQNIITIAKNEAINVKNTIINQTSEQTKHMIKITQDEISREKSRLKLDSKKEIITIAFAAAEKIIGENINKKTNQKIIEEYIKNHVE